MDKEIFSKLKGLVSNPLQWASFNNYIEELIKQQHKLMEQSDDMVVVHRAQGAINTLRNMQRLRDNVLASS
jgi:hypothetical protein